MDAVNIAIEALREELIALRRDFHQHPELGYQEVRTSGIVQQYLKELGLEPEVVTRTGVVATLYGKEDGPTILLRADMDALPVKEETGLPFASENDGVMHCCGHDGHVAMLLTAAKVLCGMKDQLKGNVKFVFQPNEEDAGAEAMIEAGVLENPKVDFCFGVHLWQPTPDGKLGLQPGAVMAGQDNFKITITGKGGHSGEPHKTIDPVLAAATVIINLQAIQTRQINVLNPTALMVNTLEAGTAPNVVGDAAVIGGSLRYLYDPDDSLEARPRVRMKEIAESTCAVFGAKCEVEFLPSSKTLINSENAVARIRPVAEAVFGQENIIPSVFMMGEDFASFTEAVPGAFAFVGVGSEEKGLIWPHHHQKFDIDEDAMPKGVELFVRLALDYLS